MATTNPCITLLNVMCIVPIAIFPHPPENGWTDLATPAVLMWLPTMIVALWTGSTIRVDDSHTRAPHRHMEKKGDMNQSTHHSRWALVLETSTMHKWCIIEWAHR